MTTPPAAPHRSHPRLEIWVKRLSFIAMVGMFLVLMMGATVTNTGSADGCGRHWPLCQGELIPSYAVSTAIEFSHRIVTALEGMLVIAVSAGAILIRRGNRQVQVLVGVMVGTIVVQSGMGAAAVMWPQSPLILASHFGISMTCFAAVFLLTRYLYEPSSLDGDPAIPRRPLPDRFRRAVWATLPLSIVVAYVGAYMRHSGNELGCSGWPTCNGKIVAGPSGPEGIAFSHRLLAASLMLLVFGLAFWARSFRVDYPQLGRVLGIASLTIVGQALAGGFVVLSKLSLGATLLHAAFMAILFVMICDACRMVWNARPRQVPASAGSARPTPAPAGD